MKKERMKKIKGERKRGKREKDGRLKKRQWEFLDERSLCVGKRLQLQSFRSYWSLWNSEAESHFYQEGIVYAKAGRIY